MRIVNIWNDKPRNANRDEAAELQPHEQRRMQPRQPPQQTGVQKTSLMMANVFVTKH